MLRPVAILCLAACAVASPAATAKQRLKLTGTAAVPADADGRRFAVTFGTPAFILDDVLRTGSAVSRCAASSPSNGFVLSLCDGEWGVLELAHRRVVPVPGVEPRDQFERVGAHWVAGFRRAPDYRTAMDLYINWRTGEQRLYAAGAGPQVDLDAERFGVPLRLSRGDLVLGHASGRIANVRPTARLRLLYRHHIRSVPTRCGGTAEHGCDSVQYGGGVLSWTEGGRACAFVPRTGKAGCFTPPGGPLNLGAGHGFGALSASHTRRAMYVTWNQGGGYDEPGITESWRVSLRRLHAPGARRGASRRRR